jgi:hypothetical protein
MKRGKLPFATTVSGKWFILKAPGYNRSTVYLVFNKKPVISHLISIFKPEKKIRKKLIFV